MIFKPFAFVSLVLAAPLAAAPDVTPAVQPGGDIPAEFHSPHVPESNGRVGSIGTSYDGFTALMTLVNPHPALKASVPINPMVDVWKGDDWFHNGAFRQEMISYVYSQTADKKSSEDWFTSAYDDYVTYLRHGSAATYGHAMGMEQLPFWQRLTQHPAY